MPVWTPSCCSHSSRISTRILVNIITSSLISSSGDNFIWSVPTTTYSTTFANTTKNYSTRSSSHSIISFWWHSPLIFDGTYFRFSPSQHDSDYDLLQPCTKPHESYPLTLIGEQILVLLLLILILCHSKSHSSKTIDLKFWPLWTKN